MDIYWIYNNKLNLQYEITLWCNTKKIKSSYIISYVLRIQSKDISLKYDCKVF